MPPPSADKILAILHAMPIQASREKLPDIAAELKSLPLGPVLEKIKAEVQRIFELTEKELELLIISQVKEEKGWNLFPSSGYFHDYLTFTKRSYAPFLYHAACSIVGIGAMLRDRVYTRWEDIKFYPNISTFFLGGSGVGKTLATGKLIRILKRVETEENRIVIIPEQMTPESMLDELSGNPTGLIYLPEFASSVGKQDYMRGMITQITRLLDYHEVPYVRKLRNSEIQIPTPAPSYILCTNIDFLRSSAPREAFGGGFWARLLPIYSEDTEREPDPFPELTTEEIALQERVIITLRELGTFKGGEIDWTPGARKLFTEWHKEDACGEKAKMQRGDDLLGPYFKRRHAFARKLAICFHVMLCRDLVLCESCLKRGLDFLDLSDSFLSVLIHQAVKSAVGEDVYRVIQIIQAEGGQILHGDLLRKTQHHMKAKEVRDIISGLIESGQVKMWANSSGARVYKLLV